MRLEVLLKLALVLGIVLVLTRAPFMSRKLTHGHKIESRNTTATVEKRFTGVLKVFGLKFVCFLSLTQNSTRAKVLQ